MIWRVQNQLLATYVGLRWLIAGIAFGLPAILGVGGIIAGLGLQGSLSDYYWAAPGFVAFCCNWQQHAACPPIIPAGTFRNVFVALLATEGMLLYLYKGYSRRENYALNVAGALAIGIAFIPDPLTCAPRSFPVHDWLAYGFFGCLAFVCEFCAKDTLVMARNEKVRARYALAYRAFAILLVVLSTLVHFLNGNSSTYWEEFAAIYVFGAYWLTKSIELTSTKAEQLALSGEMDRDNRVSERRLEGDANVDTPI